MTVANIRPAMPADLASVLALYRQLNPSDPVLDIPSADHLGQHCFHVA